MSRVFKEPERIDEATVVWTPDEHISSEKDYEAVVLGSRITYSLVIALLLNSNIGNGLMDFRRYFHKVH